MNNLFLQLIVYKDLVQGQFHYYFNLYYFQKFDILNQSNVNLYIIKIQILFNTISIVQNLNRYSILVKIF
jgi:hypothetical protein